MARPRKPTGRISPESRNRRDRRAGGRNQVEPNPEAGVPPCPSFLDERAKTRWKTITPRLHSMGVLAFIDEDALIVYCTIWSRWRDAELDIQQNGQWYASVSREGSEVWRKNPAVEIASDLATKLMRMEREFGMTPSGRASLSVNPDGGAQDQPAANPFGRKIG